MRAERPTVAEGLALIGRHVRPIGVETIPITHALGRVTAQAVLSRRTVPSFRTAAMDGFALRSHDTISATPADPAIFPITHSVAAGDWPPTLPPGEAWAISTGAPVPDGGDSVLMIEHAMLSHGDPCSRLILDGPIRTGLNVRQIGEDIVAGQTALPSGTVITPDIVAGLAAYDIGDILVRRSPSIAVLITGSELSSNDRGGVNAMIPDSNGPMIQAAAQALGITVDLTEAVADKPDALDRALERACATSSDIIISSGGASHGEHDGVAAALLRRGAHLHFHGLEMRPGKPIIFAVLDDGRPFFGLPGNPVSACVAMRFFVTHAIRCMLDLPPEPGIAVDTAEPGKEGVSVFLRGRPVQKDDGRLDVDTGFDQRSHILSSLMRADCWVHIFTRGQTRHAFAFPKWPSLTSGSRRLL